MIKKLLLCSYLALLAWCRVSAQSAEMPLGSEEYNIIDRLEIHSGQIFQTIHTSEKPYRMGDAVKITYILDSLKNQTLTKGDRYSEFYLRKGHDEFNRDGQFESSKPILKTFYTNKADFFKYVSKDFEVRINPIFNLQLGDELHAPVSTGSKFYNTRGADMSGWIDGKLGFWANVTENQFRPPVYYENWVNQYEALPGEAYYKNFKQHAFDYLDSRGGFNFKALKIITVTAAHDKNFLGNGYRSLFLSDYSAPYNFLKLQANVWRFQYEVLYAELIPDYARGADQFLERKFFTLHHLSMNIGKHVNVGLMENIMSAQPNVVKVGYLNPFILYRSAEYYYGSPDKVNVGADIKVNALRCLSFYGQLLIDDLNVSDFVKRNGWWGNKEGYQVGVKYIDALGIRNLDVQLEFNQIAPYTYTHGDSIANFTHYNQPLAHPWGANLREVVGILRYKPWHKLYITPQFSYLATGLNINGLNYGQDIFESYLQRVSDYNNKVTQGLLTTVRNVQLMISYEVKYNMFFDVQMLYRSLRNADTTPSVGDTRFITAGFRMYIAPRRFDF